MGRRGRLGWTGAAALAVAALASLLAARTGAGAGLQVPSSPSWSPDGAEIAYADSGSSSFRIVVVPAAGGRARTVLAGSSPDGCCAPLRWAAGGRIVFVEGFTLTSVPAGGGKPRKLFTSTPWFTLSPDGRTAAFTDGCGCGHAPDAVGLVGVAGGRPTVVPKPASVSDEIDGFSPDGSELVLTRHSRVPNGWGAGRLLAVPVGGGTPVPLARSGLPGAAAVPAGADRVQWSPDGRWIAFVQALRLEVVSTSGGPPRTIATHFGSDAFSWSPDSALLAYDCCSNRPDQVLATIAPGGGHRTVLADARRLRYVTSDSLDGPQWSPDGTRLVFAARPGSDAAPVELWTVGANGATLTRIG